MDFLKDRLILKLSAANYRIMPTTDVIEAYLIEKRNLHNIENSLEKANPKDVGELRAKQNLHNRKISRLATELKSRPNGATILQSADEAIRSGTTQVKFDPKIEAQKIYTSASRNRTYKYKSSPHPRPSPESSYYESRVDSAKYKQQVAQNTKNFLKRSLRKNLPALAIIGGAVGGVHALQNLSPEYKGFDRAATIAASGALAATPIALVGRAALKDRKALKDAGMYDTEFRNLLFKAVGASSIPLAGVAAGELAGKKWRSSLGIDKPKTSK